MRIRVVPRLLIPKAKINAFWKFFFRIHLHSAAGPFGTAHHSKKTLILAFEGNNMWLHLNRTFFLIFAPALWFKVSICNSISLTRRCITNATAPWRYTGWRRNISRLWNNRRSFVNRFLFCQQPRGYWGRNRRYGSSEAASIGRCRIRERMVVKPSSLGRRRRVRMVVRWGRRRLWAAGSGCSMGGMGSVGSCGNSRIIS